MRKVLIALAVFFLAGCGGQGTEEFVYNGKKYILTGDPARVAAPVKGGKAVAYRFRLADWGAVLRGLAEAGRRGGFDLRPLIDDEVMVCAACRRRLSAKERFELLFASDPSGKTAVEKKCPACGGEEFCIFLERKTR